jgi:5-(carboxyamino)imidazole ribonucleotide synthase
MEFNPFSSSFTLGILGGGQLGKMLCQEAYKMDIQTAVLDPDAHCSASTIANHFMQGSFQDFDTVIQFGRKVHVLTIEIEHVNIDALYQLEAEGIIVHPKPDALFAIQNKQTQKNFFHHLELPTAPFANYESKDQFFGEYPFVWKSATGGYDGKGVQFVRNQNDFLHLPDVPFVAEQPIDIHTEFAVIAVRNHEEVTTLPACSMVFHPTANLVTHVVCPAQLPIDIENKAREIADQLISQWGIQGLLAVEFFLDQNGSLWINEVAPRPHNSGHFTIEALDTSQYEQHIRGVLNLPLGSTRIKSPSVMVNLIGEAGQQGPVHYEGMNAVLSIEGVSVHLYGKKETRPFRKMGHVTITDSSLEHALEKSTRVQQILKSTTK